MIRFLLLTFLSIFFFSCSTAPPTENEVKEMVKLWYMQQSQGDGAGTWNVEGVTVLSVKKDENRKGVFNTTSAASGIRRHPSLAEPLPDEQFHDTVRMDIEWNGAKWVTAK